MERTAIKEKLKDGVLELKKESRYVPGKKTLTERELLDLEKFLKTYAHLGQDFFFICQMLGKSSTPADEVVFLKDMVKYLERNCETLENKPRRDILDKQQIRDNQKEIKICEEAICRLSGLEIFETQHTAPRTNSKPPKSKKLIKKVGEKI